ncbi:hypothetical protein NQT74_06440 [Alteromonas stellipolaris]|uniref:hypothetical protein n=1 Tax=Alteromonas stellipolaris TaxID=233316 RepID=UPI002118C852|nr:hypothetical protein [Alteromonas stellipolaris]MCQ8848211.1 hypothetical protein [Alteromonas stellipolaris]
MIDNFKKSADGYQKSYISTIVFIISAPYILNETNDNTIKLPSLWGDIPRSDGIYLMAIIYVLLQISLLLYAKQSAKIYNNEFLSEESKYIAAFYPSLINLCMINDTIRVLVVSIPISLFLILSFLLNPFGFQVGVIPALLIHLPIVLTICYLPKK